VSDAAVDYDGFNIRGKPREAIHEALLDIAVLAIYLVGLYALRIFASWTKSPKNIISGNDLAT